MKPLAITGASLISPVGASLAQTCTSIRAGVRGLAEHPWYRTEGWDAERDPTAPLVAAMIPGVAPSAGAERLVELAALALADVVTGAKLRRADIADCALLIALPERDEATTAWDLEATLPAALARRTGLVFPTVRTLEEGRCAGFSLCADAADLLARREAKLALLVCVDSYLTRDRLTVLDRDHRIKSARNVDGFFPGEAASALVLEAPRDAERRRARALATVAQVARGDEPEAFAGDRPSSGRGLCEALRGVLGDAPFWVVSDLNGESYRSFEWGIALARLGDRLAGSERHTMPVQSTGDVGAATFGLLASCALAAFERGHAPASEAVLFASSDGPPRAAARLIRA